jgi:hypothetical protein
VDRDQIVHEDTLRLTANRIVGTFEKSAKLTRLVNDIFLALKTQHEDGRNAYKAQMKRTAGDALAAELNVDPEALEKWKAGARVSPFNNVPKMELDIPGTVCDLLDEYRDAHGVAEPPARLFIENCETPYGHYAVYALNQRALGQMFGQENGAEIKVVGCEAKPGEPELDEEDSRQGSLEDWKRITALAMEHAGITTLKLDRNRLRDMRWDVRLSFNIFEQVNIVTIAHEADATEKDPKYIFLFEGAGLTASYSDRMRHGINRWVRSNYRAAVVIELPPDSVMRVQQFSGGNFTDVDPDKITIKFKNEVQ